MRHLFFDLDGTLTDPKPGFVRCLRHALAAVGESAPPDDVLATYIGPPLPQSLRRLLGARADSKLAEAIARYDDCYAMQGVLENGVYPGAKAALGLLAAEGWTIRIVTSKRQDFARHVLEHASLAEHVVEVVGFETSGSSMDKTRLLRALLERQAIAPDSCWMIGDRSFDMVAARENAIRSIGVLWGYGSRSELESAGAELLAESWEELVELLMRPASSPSLIAGGIES